MDRDQSCEFDVFLCHNSRDKSAVREIACELRARNIRPWLDEWELQPGLPWQRAIEQQLRTVPAAGVFVGPSGYGPWQEMEQEALLRLFVERRCPVIPVILRGLEQVPTLPLFLSGILRSWTPPRRETCC